MTPDETKTATPLPPVRSEPLLAVPYRSVVELCADHPNLAEYIRQMEDELAEAKRNRKVRLTCRDCGADGPLIGDLCAGCSDAAETEDDDTANAAGQTPAARTGERE
jgi:hypothetical protein